jgi:hypothetical protein
VDVLKDDINMTASSNLPREFQDPPPLPGTKWQDFIAIYEGKPEDYRKQVLPVAKVGYD